MLRILERIKAIAGVCCSYPYEVVNLLNNYVIESEEGTDHIKIHDEYDLVSICYDNTENRIIVNYRTKPDPSDMAYIGASEGNAENAENAKIQE